MPRMKNKSRSDGRLQSKVYIGDGKYKYVYAATQKELAEKVQEVKLKIGKGLDLTAEHDTFDAWGKRWLKKKSARVSVNWAKTLEINYRKLELLFNAEVTQLRRADLEDILDSLFTDGYSERVLKSVRDIASGIMEMCVENRVIEYNPFRAAEIPERRKTDNERRALTQEERSWIEDTPHRAQTAAMIMMYAGLRRGELIPLLWSDIDLEAGTISVNKSVEMIDGHPSIKPGGKTESAVRTVFIPKKLINYLSKVKRDSLLVVHMENGTMFTANAWRSMWSTYIKDLNLKYADFGKIVINGKPMERPKSKCKRGGVPILIPQFTAHWLRHTFITMMYLSGVDVLTAAAQAGHSDPKITMEIYTHLDAEYKQRTMEKLDYYIIHGCQMGVKNADETADRAKIS